MVPDKDCQEIYVSKVKLARNNIVKNVKKFYFIRLIPAGNYMFRYNNINTRIRREMCSKLTIKTPCSSVSIVNFEQENTGRDHTSRSTQHSNLAYKKMLQV